MHKYSLHNTAKEYAHNKIFEWQAKNPRPPEPEPRPEAPIRQVVSSDEGFIVLDPVSFGHIRIHTLVEGKNHISIMISLAQLQEFLEKALEVEVAMKEVAQWLGENEKLLHQKKDWNDERARRIQSLVAEYIAEHELDHVNYAEIREAETINED